MKIRHLTLLCAFILFSQILQVDCEKQRERKRERTEDGRDRKSQSGLNSQNRKGQKKQGQRGSVRGKFVNKENSECSFLLNEAETATLRIDCKNSESTFSCDYSGNPSSCPQYAENKKAFWKQIVRSLKKQKNICKDPKAVLKSKVCGKGPSSAHFKLATSHSSKEEKPTHTEKDVPLVLGPAETPVALPGPSSSDCVEDIDYIDQRKVAEEFCSETWLSLCNFIISMIQDKKCE